MLTTTKYVAIHSWRRICTAPCRRSSIITASDQRAPIPPNSTTALELRTKGPVPSPEFSLVLSAQRQQSQQCYN